MWLGLKKSNLHIHCIRVFEILKLSFSFKSIKGVLGQVHSEKIFVMTSVLTELVQDGNLYKSKPTFFLEKLLKQNPLHICWRQMKIEWRRSSQCPWWRWRTAAVPGGFYFLSLPLIQSAALWSFHLPQL